MSSEINIPDGHIAEIKRIRVIQQAVVDDLRDLLLSSCSETQALEITEAWKNAKQVRHWLGESLGVIREFRPDLAHPYPKADNPESSSIEPTADI